MWDDGEREYDRGAGCGKTTRPDLYGHWATGVPAMAALNSKERLCPR